MPRLESGADIDRISVSLRIRADDLDPDWVTRRLGRSPVFAARKGELRPSRNDRETTQPTGVWLYNLPQSTEWELADAIGALLDRFPSDLDIWQQLRARTTLEIWCGLHLGTWNRGAELPAALLARLTERGLGLQFDIYCDGPESE